MNENQEKPNNDFPYEYDNGVNLFKGCVGWSIILSILLLIAIKHLL